MHCAWHNGTDGYVLIYVTLYRPSACLVHGVGLYIELLGVQHDLLRSMSKSTSDISDDFEYVETPPAPSPQPFAENCGVRTTSVCHNLCLTRMT